MGKTKRKGNPREQVIQPDLTEAAAAIQHILMRFNNQGVIIGGVAASLLGRPRLTATIDVVVLISVEELDDLIQAAKDEGVNLRIKEAEAFARKNRVLLLRHSSSGINIDISLGILPFETELVERGQIINVGGVDIRIPTPEDLIIMKAVAHRPKDLEDIKSVSASHPILDKKRIQFWVNQFSQLLDMPDLWKEVESLLKSTVG